jgi:hypothetical protein
MSFGGTPKIKPPPLPDPVATPTQVSAEAMKAGSEERKRLRRRGRSSTILTPGFMAPSRTRGATLKTSMG